ncbi:MAG: hypothetical protein RLZZ339_1640 [Cyanobacteriota bacterium]
MWGMFKGLFFVFSGFFCMPRMSLKNKIALVFISSGLISAIALSLVLPEEKLILALSAPSALIGAGLGQWSSNKEDE